MSDLVPASDIERIVGADRHPTDHLGRAVSAEQTVYVLHSQACLDSGVDLRDCAYSVALDRGIDTRVWVQDRPVRLAIFDGELMPDIHPEWMPCTDPTHTRIAAAWEHGGWRPARTNTAAFLASHPSCRIGIRDEYGDEHPTTGEPL